MDLSFGSLSIHKWLKRFACFAMGVVPSLLTAVSPAAMGVVGNASDFEGLVYPAGFVAPLLHGTPGLAAMSQSRYSVIAGRENPLAAGANRAIIIPPDGTPQTSYPQITVFPSQPDASSVIVLPNAISINNSGLALIGGGTSGGKPVASYIERSGVVTEILGLLGTTINATAIASSGKGIVVGDSSFSAFTDPSGSWQQIPNTGGGVAFNAVDMNSAGTSIIGGTLGFATFVFPSGMTMPIATQTGGSIDQAAINSAGNAIISGGTYVSLVFVNGGVINLSGSLSGALTTDVDINDVGNAIVGGGVGGLPYLALVSPNGVVTRVDVSQLPTGSIKGVRLNNYGYGLITGNLTAGAGGYIAFMDPTGVVSLVTSGIGVFPGSAMGFIDVIPVDDPLTGNARKFATYINENAPIAAPYFVPAFYQGKLQNAVQTAAPTSNAVSLYTAGNNLFYITTNLATHLREQRYILDARAPQQPSKANARASKGKDWESEDQLLASLAVQDCSANSKNNMSSSKQSSTDGKKVDEKKYEKPYQFWLQGFGAWGHQKSQHTIPGFSPSTGGVTLAFDAQATCHTRAGVSLSYLYTHLNQMKSSGHSNINQEDLFGYVSWDNRCVYFDFAIGAGLFQTSQLRKTNIPGFSFKEKSHPDGWQLLPHFEFGYTGGLKDPNLEVIFNLFGMVDWANTWQQHFRETGKGPFNVSEKKQYSALVRTEAGIRFYQSWLLKSWNLIFLEKASYVNKQTFKTGVHAAALVGAPGSFTVETFPSSKNLGAAQFAVTFDPLRCFHPITTIFYQGEFGSGYEAHEVNVELAWNF